jgi:hypothetical protein
MPIQYVAESALEHHPTPTQALFRIGHLTGWCETKREFAEMLGVRQDNMYAYLADNGNKRRVRATAETIWTWCQAITGATGLHLELHLVSDGHARLVVHGATRGKIPFPTTTFEVHEPAWSKREEAEGGT